MKQFMISPMRVSEVEVSSLLMDQDDSDDSLEIDPGSLSPATMDSRLALCKSPDMDELMMNITGRIFIHLSERILSHHVDQIHTMHTDKSFLHFHCFSCKIAICFLEKDILVKNSHIVLFPINKHSFFTFFCALIFFLKACSQLLC